MPNWCSNKLSIRGEPSVITAFKQKAVGQGAWPLPDDSQKEEANLLNFHSLVPIPQEVIKAGYESAGYEWERDHWGCKWGACEADLIYEDENHLEYRFDTA